MGSKEMNSQQRWRVRALRVVAAFCEGLQMLISLLRNGNGRSAYSIPFCSCFFVRFPLLPFPFLFGLFLCAAAINYN